MDINFLNKQLFSLNFILIYLNNNLNLIENQISIYNHEINLHNQKLQTSCLTTDTINAFKYSIQNNIQRKEIAENLYSDIENEITYLNLLILKYNYKFSFLAQYNLPEIKSYNISLVNHIIEKNL